MKDTSRKTVYVIGNEHVFDMPPDGTFERPYATMEEALYSLSDEKNPEPHQLIYPKNTDFIMINATWKFISAIIKWNTYYYQYSYSSAAKPARRITVIKHSGRQMSKKPDLRNRSSPKSTDIMSYRKDKNAWNHQNTFNNVEVSQAGLYLLRDQMQEK